MSKTKKYIIFLGTLLFLYSGQIFAHTLPESLIQKQPVQNQFQLSVLFKSTPFVFTVKHPIKEVFKKGNITTDNEEEEIEGMTSKRSIEKSKLFFSVFAQLSTPAFQKNNRSLSICNDLIINHSCDSLYLLFEVFRI